MKYKALFILFIISLLFFPPMITHAQIPISITAFPAVQDITITPGERTRAQLQFKNNNNTPISGFIRVADYIISDKDGTPVLIENTELKPKYGAASWISFLYDRATIPPKDFITLDIFVDPPKEIGSCGHYTIVYFQPNETALGSPTGERNSATAVITKIGALLNLTTETKQCTESAEITSFSYPTFLEYGPITVTYDISNNGDIHLSPKGYINLSNALGQLTDQNILEEKRIFPETLKSYKHTFGKKWMFGPYTIHIKSTYGMNDDKILTKTAVVWVLPWKVMTVVFFALLIFVYFARKSLIALILKERKLETELQEEKQEIEKLKGELKKKQE